MSRKLQTTFYNGKLTVNEGVSEELRKIHTSIGEHVKRVHILNFFKKIANRLSQRADQVLQVVVNDMIHLKKKNYCGKYQVWAGDILYLFSLCNPRREYIDALQVQLLEMHSSINGGRCIRLYPLVCAVFKDNECSTEIEFVDESESGSEDEIEIEF